MVILQRWKPIISETFPSLIPFWIRIRGLPLHFWQDDFICNIGKELGTLEKHELTKTSARVRVLVDGLKPLIKENIIEYESGEESKITFEYENLENHCTRCLLLSHKSEHCPSFGAAMGASPLPDRKLSFNDPTTEVSQPFQARRHSPRKIADNKGNERVQEFNYRIDRHERNFGERVSTRHTRNPPPVRDHFVELPLHQRKGREDIGKQIGYSSPPLH